MKLSFKRHKKEGQYRSFQATYIDIKADRRVCGRIYEVRDDGSFRIGFMVKREPTVAYPAPFENIRLSKICATEVEARDFVTRNWDAICKRYDLYQLED